MSSSLRRRQLTPILLVCFITYLSYRNLFAEDDIAPPSLRPDLPPNAHAAPPPVSTQPPAHYYPIHPTTDLDDDGFDDGDEIRHHQVQIIEDENYFDSSNFPTQRFPLHKYRPDGFVLVNSEGRHPIHDLIQRSRKKWQQKHQRQSRNLQEACKEYKRRYRRDPPPGFDHW
jgi:hypothetical protein